MTHSTTVEDAFLKDAVCNLRAAETTNQLHAKERSESCDESNIQIPFHSLFT